MLKKLNRLTKTKDIQTVMKTGRPFYAPLLMLKIKANDLDLRRVTVVVSTKVSKKATARNLVKRRIREAILSVLTGLKNGWDGVILASPRIINPQGKTFSYNDIKANLIMVFKKSGLL